MPADSHDDHMTAARLVAAADRASTPLDLAAAAAEGTRRIQAERAAELGPAVAQK